MRNLLSGLALLLLLSACQQHPIGGDRDVHDCLIAAGYSYAADIGACVRPFDLDAAEREAAKKAVDAAGLVNSTVSTVTNGSCDGCYEIIVTSGNETRTVNVVPSGPASNCDIGLSLTDARNIAQRDCPGNLTTTADCNNGTKTWWLGTDLKKEGCSPACVVSADTKTAEINWRCTGLIPPVNSATLKECTTTDDCVPVGCGCTCSGCGGFSYEDVVNKRFVDTWFSQKGCPRQTVCPMVCCEPVLLNCVQGICTVIHISMNKEDARAIADVYCQANLSDQADYDQETQTWQIALKEKKTACSPTCVVHANSRTAEIHLNCKYTET